MLLLLLHSILSAASLTSAVEFLVIGGEYNHQSLQTFDPDNPERNRILKTKLEGGILHHVSALTHDKKRLLIGGGQQISETGAPGEANFQRSANMWYFDMESREVHKAIPLRMIRSGAGMAEIGGNLLVCGGVEGKFGGGGDRCVHRSCETLKDAALGGAESLAWQTAPAMLANRGTFAMVEMGGRVYAIGGEIINTGKSCPMDGERQPVLDSVEVYDPSTRSWSYIASLKHRRFAHAAAVHSGQIYVCGGHSWIAAGMGDELAPCERYDERFGRWAPMADNQRPRANHAMLAHGDFVYVFAGSTIPNDRTGQEFHDRDHSLFSVERYSLASDRWELLPCHLKQGAYAATAVALPEPLPEALPLTATAPSLPRPTQSILFLLSFFVLFLHFART